MGVSEKKIVAEEARMQMAALKKIGRWKNMAVAVSAAGVAAVYAGFGGAERNLVLGIIGAAVITVSIAIALVLNLGLRNGKRNVRKMLDLLDGGTVVCDGN